MVGRDWADWTWAGLEGFLLKTLLSLCLHRYMMPLFELTGHYSLSSQRFTRAQQCAGVDGALRSGRDISWRTIHPTSRSALVAQSRWRAEALAVDGDT